MTEAVQYFVPNHPAVSGSVRGRLIARRQELLENLRYAPDWPDFKRRIGVLQATEEAIEICNEVEKDLTE